MKYLTTLLLLFFTLSVYAEECTYTMKPKNLKVSWKAYKTPLKIGVGGKFTQLGVEKIAKGKNFAELISGIEFKIDASSTSTKDKARDAKIVKFFFSPMKGGTLITGKTLKYSKKVLKVALTMNGVTKVIPLKVELEKDNEFEAEGVIDVLDFNLSDSLAGINKACEVLHEGKTWSDVAIELEGKFSKNCE